MSDGPLSFDEFSDTNAARCKRWHGEFPESHKDPRQDWTLADWGNAMGGECGEAQNVIKKIRRVQTGTDLGPDDPSLDDLFHMLGDEIADTITYADLLLTRACQVAKEMGVNWNPTMEDVLVRKFDRVSERQGFPERMGLGYSR